jgi:nitrate reductase gamma subunit
LFFLGAAVIKVVKYARTPVHLRWELYPVANDTGRDSDGSYLEEMDWRSRPRRKSDIKALAYIVHEMFVFDKCRRNNRGLWYFTQPFHIGLFLLVGWIGLLLVVAIATAAGASVGGTALDQTWLGVYLLPAVGGIGLALGIYGSVGLLIKRLVDKELKEYTAPIDYFNLVFLLAIFVSGLFAWYFFGNASGAASAFMKGLITFDSSVTITAAVAVNLLLLVVMLLYMPFTNLMHGFAKYFTYHQVFWEDEPNCPGDELEKRVASLLERRVSWSAPHVRSGQRWSDNTPERPQEK